MHDESTTNEPREISQRDRAAELRAKGRSAATARQIAADERMMGDIVDPLPEDWDVWEVTPKTCAAMNIAPELAGWALSRDHGSLVVGAGYVSKAQALDVARRVLAEEG